MSVYLTVYHDPGSYENPRVEQDYSPSEAQDRFHDAPEPAVLIEIRNDLTSQTLATKGK